MNYRSDIEKVVNQVSIIDTHEHLLDVRFDLRAIIRRSYAWWVLPGSGHTSAVKCSAGFEELPEEEWWDRVLPGLALTSNTAFVKHLFIAFRDLYGFDESPPTKDNMKELAEKIRLAHADPTWYDTVITERANVDAILHDKYWAIGDVSEPRSYLKPVIRLDSFLYGYSRSARDHDGNTPYTLADEIGFSVSNFDDYLALLDAFFEKGARSDRANGENGTGEGKAVALKIASAYDRPLFFGKPTAAEARASFDRFYRTNAPSGDPDSLANFQDFVVRYAIDKAVEYELPVQIHTGLGRIQSSNPIQLWSLVEDYPDVKFDLFHGGYPWTRESAALALSYENVYLDLCWLPVISPTAAKDALSEWLEVVPQDRILWGGDCWSPDALYGAVRLARETISEVLNRKVSEGYLSIAQAEAIAHRILRENARALYPKINTRTE